MKSRRLRCRLAPALLLALLAAVAPQSARSEHCAFGCDHGFDEPIVPEILVFEVALVFAGVYGAAKLSAMNERPDDEFLSAAYTLGGANLVAGGVVSLLGITLALEPQQEFDREWGIGLGIFGAVQMLIGGWSLVATWRAERLPQAMSLTLGPLRVAPFVGSDGRGTVAGVAGWF